MKSPMFSWSTTFTWRMNDDRWLFRSQDLVDVFFVLFCSGNEQNMPPIQGTQLMVFIPNDKILIFEQKLECWKMWRHHSERDSLLILQYFSDEDGGVWNAPISGITLYVGKSVVSRHPIYDITRSGMCKINSNCRIHQMDLFNVKLICFQISHCYSTLLPVEFWCNTREELPYLSLVQPHTCVIFLLCLLQPELHSTERRRR